VFQSGNCIEYMEESFRPSGVSSCIIRAVIRSETGVLSGCSCLIACLSSLIVKARSFSEHRLWFASCRSISGSRVSSCGVKTSARWRANRSTFSVSLFAQGPGSVEILRIGGIGVLGFFLDLSGFQMD
jgi:hypothetical protein